MFITFIIISPLTASAWPCTQRSAQKNFHAAIISRLATNVKRTKDMTKSFHRSTTIAPNVTKVLTQRCRSASRDEMSIHFHGKNLNSRRCRNYWFQTIFARIAYLLQRLRRYDVTNSIYHCSKFPHCNAGWRPHTPMTAYAHTGEG